MSEGIELVVDGVTKRYGNRTVVDDLSFTVTPGRVTGFLGPNGSGKSTTMKVMLGLAAADGGSALVGDCAYAALPDPSRTVGAALETNAFHPGRSGRDHLRILACATGIPGRRIDEALETAGLADAADQRAGEYSLGMRQRLGLAAALLGDPPVLVLDEPGNGLDPQGVRDLRDLLRGRARRGDTVFVSSHLLGEVEHLVDDVVVINRGKLVTTGSLQELQQQTAVVRTPTPDQLADALRSEAGATVDVVTAGPDVASPHLLVRGMSLDEIGSAAFTAGVELWELSASAGSLEEMFLRWTAAIAEDVTVPGASVAGHSGRSDEEVV